ncbi:hypothetical protein Tco_1326380 [Tanacetum coccineum]
MVPLPPRDQRHLGLRYQIEGYTEEIDLAERMRMVYTRDDGQEVFVSHAWRRLFRIRAPLVQEFILEFFSTCRIGDGMGLDMAETLCFQMGGFGSERLIPDKGDLSDYWVKISFGREFLRGAPSYTYIRDPVWRLCQRLISYSISGRGQAPEKYLFRHVEGRKSYARLSGGHLIGRHAHHFGLVSDDGLRGLSVMAPPGPERQQVAMAGAPTIVEDAPLMDASGLTYQAFDETFQRSSPAAFQRRTRIKPGSKFSTIVQEYVTEPSRIFTPKYRMRKRKKWLNWMMIQHEEDKSNLKTLL